MAKKDEVEKADEVAETDEEAVARAIESAARKKKLLLLVAIGVVLLLVAGGGTWFALRLLSGDKDASAEVKVDAPAEAAKDEKAAKGASAKEKPAHKQAAYDVLEPAFLANYQVAGRQHYLQLTLAVMMREEGAINAVNAHMPLLRNRIVMLLSGEVFEELQTDSGRVQLQQKLLAAIQEILKKETGKPQIEQVFFVNFVMQ